MDTRKQQVYEQLRTLYHNPASPGAYGGIDRLYRAIKQQQPDVRREEVEEFLRSEYAYSLHRPARKRFTRNKTYVQGIDAQWQADLADMHGLSRHNGGYKYLLTVIDVFSKFAWVIPVRNKGSAEMVNAFKQLFNQTAPRLPKKLQTDKGKEFINRQVQQVFQDQGVHHFTTHSVMKAAVVERFNRTLKTDMWHYFTEKQTKRYLDVLPQLLDSYNNRYHRSIRMSPSSVTHAKETQVWRNLYNDGGKVRCVDKSIMPAQKVRISNSKGDFAKGYMPNWSGEDYHISGAHRYPRNVYKLQDSTGKDLKGTWYREEIQPIGENRYIIEKVLQRKAGEALVKWKHWPEKYNTWISIKDLKKYD